jgi:hypothetical protein
MGQRSDPKDPTIAAMTPSTYLDGLATRLADDNCDPQRQTWDGATVLVARRADFRLRWMASRLHLFVIASTAPEVTLDGIEQFMATATQYARDHKGGLPAGLQTGVAVMPALISDRVEPAAAWAMEKFRGLFACIQRPTIVDTSTGIVSQWRGVSALGAVFAEHLRRKGELYFPTTRP